jgi:hypothetical protein
LRISDKIGGQDHDKKGPQIHNLVASAKCNKQQNDNEHLSTNKDIFAIETKGISLVNTVSTGEDVRAELK